MVGPRACFVVTGAVSFNLLCRGQLEFFRDHSDLDVVLVCGDEQGELAPLIERRVGRVINVDMVRKPSVTRDILALLRLIVFFARNRFDIVVYSTPKAMLLGSVSAFVTRQPVRIALFRGRVYENFTGWRRKAFVALDKLAAALSHRCVFIARSLLEASVSDGIVSKPKALVLGDGSSNGVNAKLFNPGVVAELRGPARAALGYSDDDFVVLTVGRFSEDKGARDLYAVVSLLRAVPEAKFLVVGRAEGSKAGQLLSEMVASAAVRHLPQQREMSAVFAAADLHLFLSHREGFGNVAIEAAACGVPTVGYDIVGVRDSINAGISGERFPLGDTDGVGAFVRACVADKEDFPGRYSDASAWALGRYRQEQVWKNYLSFFKLMLRREAG